MATGLGIAMFGWLEQEVAGANTPATFFKNKHIGQTYESTAAKLEI
jgi:hypothetical protein